jgi:group I intron endonuclease
MTLYTIYRILNLMNGKAYIGQTRTRLSARMASHRYEGSSCAIHGAIKKHGWENFRVDVLESGIQPCDIDDRERYWIKEHNTTAPNGYNLEGGGNGLKIISDETRRRMAIAKTGKKRGPMPESTKQKIGNANRGRKPSPQCRAAAKAKGSYFATLTSEQQSKFASIGKGVSKPKHTEAWKEWAREKFSGRGNPFYGKKHSYETRLKIKAALALARSEKEKT